MGCGVLWANCNQQGTLAKSGTSDFLAKTEGQDTTGAGNLIGAFGLGFYSSFLVADRVHVASIPSKTKTNLNPVQHVFSSSADDTTFEVYPDPRGNTLGRGTEITLFLKQDAIEYLEESRITGLMYVFPGGHSKLIDFLLVKSTLLTLHLSRYIFSLRARKKSPTTRRSMRPHLIQQPQNRMTRLNHLSLQRQTKIRPLSRKFLVTRRRCQMNQFLRRWNPLLSMSGCSSMLNHLSGLGSYYATSVPLFHTNETRSDPKNITEGELLLLWYSISLLIKLRGIFIVLQRFLQRLQQALSLAPLLGWL